MIGAGFGRPALFVTLITAVPTDVGVKTVIPSLKVLFSSLVVLSSDPVTPVTENVNVISPGAVPGPNSILISPVGCPTEPEAEPVRVMV